MFFKKFIKMQLISRKKLGGEHLNLLHIDSFLLYSKDEKGTISFPMTPPPDLHPLYPFHSVELDVVFVYGKDFTRQMNILFIPMSVQLMAALIVLFMGLATIALSILRRKWNLRRRGLITTFIDTLIAFISGGNLRMQHKLERWFFGILLFGAFFLTSIFAGDLLDCVYQILNQEVSTFDQLAEINAPIFINPTLSIHNKHILGLLRFVL